MEALGPSLTGARLVNSLRQVVEGQLPVRLVTHWSESEGGEWEFLTGGSYYVRDTVKVTFADLVKLDPTLAGIADLREEWCAKRTEVGGQWHRKWIYEGMPYQPLEDRA